MHFWQKFLSSDAKDVEEFVHRAAAGMSFAFALNMILALAFGVKGTYGRYTTTAQGPRVNGRIDWFAHAISLIAVYAVANMPDARLDYTQGVLLTPFVIHYVNRSFIHGLRVPEVKPIPISTLLMAFTFCLVNGTLITREITKVKQYSPDFIPRSWQCSLGLVVWFAGFAGNIYHDSLLFALKAQSIKEIHDRETASGGGEGDVFVATPRGSRRGHHVRGDSSRSPNSRRSKSGDGVRDGKRGVRSKSRERGAVAAATVDAEPKDEGQRKSTYKIPHGGLFEYVSGANYFCEIVEWIGYAIMTDFSLAVMAFAWCSFCFIGTRASHHHDWYLNEFKDRYKRLGRKRLIPFIW